MTDIPPQPPARIYQRYDETRGAGSNVTPIVTGSNVYGRRLNGPVTISHLARRELEEAVRRIRWYREALLTRFGEDDDVSEITDILEDL